MTDDLRNKIELFFKNPRDFDGKQARYSTLYLLRRDVDLCFGNDPNTGKQVGFSALFPGAMAILAGIDLVAKFIYGDEQSGVSRRYKDYIFNYIDGEFNEELYQLRNALLHSFGLYSKKGEEIYRFVLVRRTGRLINRLSEEGYQVNIDLLNFQFEKSLEVYREQLMASEQMQSRFDEMFPKYGLISIG